MTQVVPDTGNRNMTETAERFDTLVLGLGRTGLSCIRYLAGSGARLGVADTRQEPPELQTLKQRYPLVPFFPGEFDAGLLCRASRLNHQSGDRAGPSRSARRLQCGSGNHGRRGNVLP